MAKNTPHGRVLGRDGVKNTHQAEEMTSLNDAFKDLSGKVISGSRSESSK